MEPGRMAQHFNRMKVRINTTKELVADDEASKTDVAEKEAAKLETWTLHTRMLSLYTQHNKTPRQTTRKLSKATTGKRKITCCNGADCLREDRGGSFKNSPSIQKINADV